VLVTAWFLTHFTQVNFGNVFAIFANEE